MIKNKKVFILGGSSDIGLSLMKIYLKNNYEVIAHYNKGSKKFFDFLKKNKKISKCSIFINAAAFLEDIKYNKITAFDLAKNFNANLIPGVMFTKILGDKMCQKKEGRIVHLSSIGVKFGGGSSTFSYSLAKHGLEFFPKITELWAEKNVFINTVRVGLTDTKIHKNLPNKNLLERIKLIPIKRMATTNEIAKFIYILGSEENTYITRQVIPISGGE